MNVPRLRFKNEKGQDFPDWEERMLGDIALKIQSGKSIARDITGEYSVYGSTGKIGYAENYEYEGRKVLVARVGANAGNLYKVDGQYCVTDNTLILDIASEYNFDYIYYLLNVSKLRNLVFGSGQPLITGGQLKKLNVAIPSNPEQTRIANFLTAVDEKITQLIQKCDLLAQYKKGVMQQIFSQELRFKDDDGQDYPEWEEVEVGDIFKVTRGNVLAMPLVSEEPSEENLYPVYSSQTKNIGLAGFYKEYLFEDCITWTTDGANAGDVNFRKGKFYCTNVCGVLKSDKGYANLCIAEMINAVSKKHVSYVGNPKLMNNVMAKIAISFPALAEQTKIANFLSVIDEKITQTHIQLTAVKHYKQGLLQQMFV